MKRQNFAVALRVLGLAVLALVLLTIRSGVFAGPPNGESLFTDAATRGSIDLSNDPTMMRTRFVNINLNLLTGSGARTAKGSTLALNLFADTAFTAVLDHVDSTPKGIIWVGHVQNVALSTVTLVTEGDMLVGSIVMPGATYSIRYAGGNVYAINQVNQAAFAPEAPPIKVDLPHAYTVPQLPNAITTTLYLPLILNAAGGPVIDVMILYTPAAVTAVGNLSLMTALVNLGISNANTSYQNSGINQRVNLVYQGQVSYTESGDISLDLSSVRAGSGALSGVPTLRNTYKADLVSLWVTGYSSTQACGIGYLMTTVSNSFAPSAYNVVDQNCVSANHSFAHEMGHNMGANHDWYADNSVVPYPYAHGYIYTPGKWRTIMAYNNLCAVQGFNCNRLLYWANPGVLYGGVPMGVPAGTSVACTLNNIANPPCDADDHLALNNTAATVAGFR